MSFFDKLFSSKGKTKTNTNMSQDTSGQQTDLAPEVLSALEELLGTSLTSGGTEQAQAAASKRIVDLESLDSEAIAKGITEKATRDVDLQLESELNRLLTSMGSSSDSNSMGALMKSRLLNDAAVTKAGIQSNTMLDVEKFKTDGILGSSNTLSQQIMTLLGQTRGARTAGSMSTKAKQTGTGTSTQRESPMAILGDLAKLFVGAG